MENVSDLSRVERQQYLVIQLLNELENFSSFGELLQFIQALEETFIVDEGLSINSKFNNKSNATNVLAFIGDIEQEKELGLSPPFLGDIVVCLAVVEKEASALDISVSSHFIHMVVHGFLHLLGYDHFSDEEENKMKLIENKVLAILDERGELN